MNATPATAAESKETVLVVEDSGPMRLVVKRQLEELGFRILEAGDADEALKFLENGGKIDLLFTDVVMPGKTNGLELARIAKSRWPQLKVVLTSGFPDAGPGMPTGVRLLSKPYLKQDLNRVFREILAS